MTSSSADQGLNPTTRRIIEALQAAAGMTTHAASALGIDRKTLESRIAAEPELLEALEDIREEVLDTAESAVIRGAKGGNVAAIIFFLSHRGQDRGYGPQPAQRKKARKKPRPTA